MSRRSIFGRSRKHHTIPYSTDVDTNVTHWRLESVQYKGSNDQGSEEERPVRDFAYTAWVTVDDFKPLDDGEGTIEFVTRANVDMAMSVDNGLSAIDIRGAVGGEAIPGISSGYSSKPQSSVEPESKEVSTMLETSVEPVSIDPTDASENASMVGPSEPVSESETPAKTEDVEMQDA